MPELADFFKTPGRPPENSAPRGRHELGRRDDIPGTRTSGAVLASTTREWDHATNSTGEVLVEPRISVITIGVDDLERSLSFYRDGLGLPTQGIVGREFEHGAVAFFDLQSGLKLAIWSRADLAHDTGIPRATPGSPDFTLGHNVRSEREVDAVMEQARKAGAKIVKPAQNTFWGGYAGYFQDLDGHLWEVVFNPSFLPVDDPAADVPANALPGEG